MRRCGQSRRRDANEAEIVIVLEQAGAAVYRLSGRGVPDLLCCYRGTWTPLEVKTATGTLTPAQRAKQVVTGFQVVRTPREALKAIIGGAEAVRGGTGSVNALLETWRTAALLKDRTRRAIRNRHRVGESLVSLAEDYGLPVEFVDALCAWQLFGDDDAAVPPRGR